MTRPRALLASRLFSPEVSAAAFRLRSLVIELVNSGAHVTVVTTNPPTAAASITDPAGVRVYRAPVLRDAGGNVRGYLQYASFDVPLGLRVLFRSFDVAIAESPPTTGIVLAVVAALRRRPFVYYAADVWTDGVRSMGANAMVVRVMEWMERRTLRRSRTVLSASDAITARLVDLGADPRRVVTVQNGVDTTVFRPDGPLPDVAEEYLVYTGTMSEWQRPEVFVRAFARLADRYPELKLRFFGQGSSVDNLKILAEELVPGRVVFGGVVPPEEAAMWIRGALLSLVSIAPGIGYDIARPTKAYAAAACGTPVLFAGPEPGRAFIDDAGIGRGVEFRVDSIASAIEEMIQEERAPGACAERASRVSWVDRNASLRAVGQRAAAAVLATLGRAEREL